MISLPTYHDVAVVVLWNFAVLALEYVVVVEACDWLRRNKGG